MGGRVTEVFGRIWKEAVVVETRIFPGWTEESHEKLRCFGRNSNRVPPEYKSKELLPLQSAPSIRFGEISASIFIYFSFTQDIRSSEMLILSLRLHGVTSQSQ